MFFVHSFLPARVHLFIHVHSFILCSEQPGTERAGPELTELAWRPCSEWGVWGQTAYLGGRDAPPGAVGRVGDSGESASSGQSASVLCVRPLVTRGTGPRQPYWSGSRLFPLTAGRRVPLAAPAQAAQSCCPHRHHQAFTHCRSHRVRPPHAHVCSLSSPARPRVHTGPGAACLGQSHTLPRALWGHGTHVCENNQMHSTVAPLGTPTRASLPRARTCPGHLLHRPVCIGARAQLCQHPPTGLCLFFNSHAGRLYSGPVSVLSSWEFTQPCFQRSELGTARSPIPR